MLRLPSFTYLQPKTLHEALAMKVDAGPDGVFVSGGTDLYPNMKRRQQEPKIVISLMGIPELQKTEGGNDGRTEGRTVVGSCITLRSEEHTSELQSQSNLVCRLLLEKKKNTQ